MIRFLLVIIILFVSCKGKRKNEIQPKTVSIVDTIATKEINIVFVGDVMAHSPQINSAIVDKQKNIYNFNDCFKYVAPYWIEADAVIANLETTLSDKRYSGYPLFSAPYTLVNGLKSAGVTHIMLANNHICDKGAAGITKTTTYLEKMNIPYAGAFIDSLKWNQQNPLFIKKNDFNIAALNYTYGTNGMPIPRGMVVGIIDTTQIAKDINKAKIQGATNIIAFMHWGYEYNRKENKEQSKLAEWLRSKGVDIIIGSHPHVVQPIKIDSNGIIAYSLGNFISNQRDRYKNGGINIHLNLKRQNNKTEYKATYRSYYVYKTVKSPRYFCVDSIAADSIIVEPSERIKANTFFNDTRLLLKNSQYN